MLVADKNTQFVIEGLLSRREALAIRPFHYDIYIHPQHDPGVYHQAPSFLEVFQNQYLWPGTASCDIEGNNSCVVVKCLMGNWRRNSSTILY